MEAAPNDSLDAHQSSRMTSAEIEQVKALLDMGLSHRMIADQIGRSRTAISKLARRLGLDSKIKKRPWTEDDFLTVSRLLAAGKSYGIIALVLGRTQKAVEQYICTHKERLSVAKAAAPAKPKPAAPTKPKPEPLALPQHPRRSLPESDLYQRWLGAMRRRAVSMTT